MYCLEIQACVVKVQPNTISLLNTQGLPEKGGLRWDGEGAHRRNTGHTVGAHTVGAHTVGVHTYFAVSWTVIPYTLHIPYKYPSYLLSIL